MKVPDKLYKMSNKLFVRAENKGVLTLTTELPVTIFAEHPEVKSRSLQAEDS